MKHRPAAKPHGEPSKVKTFHLEYQETTPPDEAEARKEVIEEYANSLREFITVIRNGFN
jgi:hypothetical protein